MSAPSPTSRQFECQPSGKRVRPIDACCSTAEKQVQSGSWARWIAEIRCRSSNRKQGFEPVWPAGRNTNIRSKNSGPAVTTAKRVSTFPRKSEMSWNGSHPAFGSWNQPSQSSRDLECNQSPARRERGSTLLLPGSGSQFSSRRPIFPSPPLLWPESSA